MAFSGSMPTRCKHHLAAFRGIRQWKRHIIWQTACFVSLGATLASAETLTVLNSQNGTTPARLGYNLGHFMPNSNAADWFRYSGVDAARVFISVSEIEPSDDISPVGDGVNSESSFFSRRSLLRANAASTTATLSTSYVRWSTFIGNYADITNGTNRIQLSSTLANLRDRGVSILANITASDSRFPITGVNDWAGKWELWQHFYAQAFLLSRDYGVRNFSMFNEPNLWVGMTEQDWLIRHRLCSDAFQSAVVDMNSRYGKSLVPQVFAPNTANGAEKYNTPGIDPPSAETWGRDAVSNRHLRLDGTSSPSWMNLHLYNYQKYTTRTNAGSGFSGYIEDYNDLRSLIDADTLGEPSLPIVLTEFNVRTAASYDGMTATQNSPTDYTALGANCIALTGRGVNQLYLFKFGQTVGTNTPVYGVVKNGTHYVENTSAGDNNYGGATQCAEVYRLYNKAAKGARPRFSSTATSGASPTNTAGVWSLFTYDATRGTYSAFIVNKGTSAVPLEVDFSAWPLPADNPAYVEEVSASSNGGVVRMTRLAAGKLTLADMPAQSVWLVTVPGPAQNLVTRSATEDAQLGDGTSKLLTGAIHQTLQVRADGTADGRRVALVKIPIPGGNSPNVRSILLQLNVATNSGTAPVQAHVYGVTNHSWQEATATWANSAAVLKQNVVSGNQIQHNIVAAQGTTNQMLGQMVADSPVFSQHSLDVTDFVKSSSGGFATFLIVQEHRWDIAQPALTVGDTQAEGLLITSKESTSGGPQLVALTADTPPSINSSPQSLAVNPGAPASFQVTATGTAPLTYQWRKNGNNIPGATSANFTIPNTVDTDAGSYDVVVGNIANSISSNIAVLTILGASPFISLQPQSTTISAGATVSLTVTAAGAAPLSYQWTRSGMVIPGAVLSSLTIASATGADVGDYRVTVANPLGSVTSAPASLAVTAVTVVAREAVIRGGTSAALDVDEAAAGYLMVKFSSSLNTSRKAYFQFDLPLSGVDLDAPATFSINFTEGSEQAVQLWALNADYPGFTAGVTWNNAQANNTSTNGMLSGATPVGAPVLIDPGPGLASLSFTLPRLGDFAGSGRVTLVLSGVDDALNDPQGLRVSRASASLIHALDTANTPPTISDISHRTVPEDTPTSVIDFTIGDAETPTVNLVLTVTSSNTNKVPISNILLGGSGANRTIQVSPAANQVGQSTVTLTVTDEGGLNASDSLVVTITAVNDAPTISTVPDLTIPEDQSSAAMPLTVGDVETPAESLSLSASSSNPVLLPMPGIVLGGAGQSRIVTLTPAPGLNGSATVTMTVSDGTLETSIIFEVTVFPDVPWVDWKQARFGNDWEKETIAGPSADPDRDGIRNLLEYALGGLPLASDPAVLPRVNVPGGATELRFTRNPAITDLRLTVQVAEHLSGSWTDAAESVAGAAFTSLTAGVTVSEMAVGLVNEVTFAETMIPERQRRFLRLKAEMSDP